MTTLASALIGKAKILAQDTTAIRWTDPEWLGWLSDGQREICIIRPSAYSKIANVTLAAGTKQSIPADGVEFIEYIRAMGASGTVPGLAARKVPRRMLDASIPGWHLTAGAAAVPIHYVYEPQAPKFFYVYPASTGAQLVEILYAASPIDVASTATAIALDDVYGGPLIDYMMYRAYLKDSEFQGNAERSLLFRKAFENTMGLKAIGDASTVASDSIKG